MLNINWDGVIQSIVDFWLPTIGWGIGLIILLVLIIVIKNYKKDKEE